MSPFHVSKHIFMWQQVATESSIRLESQMLNGELGVQQDCIEVEQI